jgi:type I restriction enzyme S subunit
MRGLQNGIGFGTTELIVVRPEEQRLSPYFLHYLFTSTLFRQAGESLMYGAGGQKRVPDSFVRDAVIPLPSPEEQAMIGAFLDREIAKIDTLVAEQERLITLLTEKRQAVISHAVTKGLNPNAPMKDSGNDWIGDIPKSWSIVRLGDLVSALSTGPFGTVLSAADYVSGGVPIINPSHVLDGILVPQETVTADEATAKALARWRMGAGDIVVARRGEIGRCGLVTSAQSGWICGTGCLFVTPRAETVIPDFLTLSIGSSYSRAWLQQWSVGSTMSNLNERLLAALPISVPSTLQEQRALLSELGRKLEGLNTLVNTATGVLDVLRERRSAIVTAAVTGQIDVRHVARAEAA